MDLNEYQQLATRTINQSLTAEQLVDNMLLGIIGEYGEFVDALKKHLFQGHRLPITDIIIEIGDVFWYLANLATLHRIELQINHQHQTSKDRINTILEGHKLTYHLIVATQAGQTKYMTQYITALASTLASTLEDLTGASIYDCIKANIQRLQHRYPERFTVEASVQRIDTQTMGQTA